MANQKNKGKASSQKGQSGGGRMSVKRTGDYTLNTNRPVIARQRGPTITPTASGKGVAVCNTERLGTSAIFGNGSGSGFAKSGISLNPASTNLFPWLSNIAKNYQLYRWKSIKISYIPAVPTTESGYVEAAVFYDYEDFVNWFNDTTFAYSLSYLGDYATGPPYSGGQISVSEDRRGTSTQNWFGVNVDVVAAHRRYPWLTVDPSTGADHTANLAVGAYMAFQTYTSTGTQRIWGLPFISYEVEFLHPAVSVLQTPTTLLRSSVMAAEDDSPICFPGGKCPRFPPAPPPPESGDREVEP